MRTPILRRRFAAPSPMDSGLPPTPRMEPQANETSTATLLNCLATSSRGSALHSAVPVLSTIQCPSLVHLALRPPITDRHDAPPSGDKDNTTFGTSCLT